MTSALLGAADDGRRVMNHHVERDRQRRVVAEHRRRHRVADEQHVDARTLEQPRHRRVVGGQDGELLAPLLAIFEM